MGKLWKEDVHHQKHPKGKSVKNCQLCVSSATCQRCRGICIFSPGYLSALPRLHLNKNRYLNEKYFLTETTEMDFFKSASINQLELLVKSASERIEQRTRNYKRELAEVVSEGRIVIPSKSAGQRVIELVEWFHEQPEEIKVYMRKIHHKHPHCDQRKYWCKGNQLVNIYSHPSDRSGGWEGSKTQKKQELEILMRKQLCGYY